MNLPDWHVHISEREPDGTFEDCTWDSGLEWYRLCYDKSEPATHAEAQALRAASGEPPTGGSNIGDLRRGIAKRYGKSVSLPVSGFSALWTALKPGTAAVVQGSMAAFGPTHPLSKYDRNFDGGHAVCVLRLDATDRVWWCDPEAPLGIGYKGVWVTKAQLKSYVDKIAGQHLVRAILAPPVPALVEPDMPNILAYAPGTTIVVRQGSNVRRDPSNNAAPLRVAASSEAWTVIGTVKGEALAGTDTWYVRWSNGHYEYLNKNGVTTVGAPITASDVSAAVLAAVKPLNEKIAAAKAALG